jgi:PAS domain S-box-containing protein
LIFLAMAVLVLATIVITWQMGMMTLRAEEALDREQDAIGALHEVLSTVKDAETGQRGYLLTGDEQFLRPYEQSLARIGGELNALDHFADTGQLQRSDVVKLTRVISERLSELRRTIDLVHQQKKDEALTVVAGGKGRRLMDDLRRLVQTTVSNETIDLAMLHQSSARWSNYRTLVIALAALLNLAFLYWAYRKVRREIAARQAAADETARQKDLLNVTLGSIGDAVIVTDPQARITFMNQEAQRLTGWSAADAMAASLAQVFNIVNEETRQAVANPIEKVLREGVVAGLPNHTVLIRRDGTQIPIDDSGAPVRETGGPIRGAVLVFRDFSAHRQAEQNLLASKSQLEEANQSKDRFLAMLSHELRTPLMPVLTTLSAWESADLPPHLFPEIQMLRRNVELEAKLIDDLLDLNRIITGKLALHQEPADVHGLLHDVAGMYQSEIHSKRVSLSMRLEAGRTYVSADPGRLQQVFWNILKNAVKFTPEGGHIEITSDTLDNHLVLSFKDDDIGMTCQALGKIFVPFQQGTETIHRSYGGLGLGMAIAKALVDAQGGSISAASDGPGCGSTFTLSLPLVEMPARDHAASHDGEGAPYRSLNILLVEDHQDTADALARLLRGKGHRVQIAGSVAAALRLASEEPFDIVLSDIGLPDGTGIDLIRALRLHRTIPAIALTGYGMEDDVQRCSEAGFAAHLTKPVNFQRLETTLQRTTSRL